MISQTQIFAALVLFSPERTNFTVEGLLPLNGLSTVRSAQLSSFLKFMCEKCSGLCVQNHRIFVLQLSHFSFGLYIFLLCWTAKKQ